MYDLRFWLNMHLFQPLCVLRSPRRAVADVFILGRLLSVCLRLLQLDRQHVDRLDMSSKAVHTLNISYVMTGVVPAVKILEPLH